MDVFSTLSEIKARVTHALVLSILSASLMAQTNIVLQMDQKLGDKPFSYGLTSKAELGYYFNVSRLQYYVSEIKLFHDGGQQTPVENLHLLIDPAKDSIFNLGTFPIADIEQIEFWIGVDSAHNHLDPALYPANHPLALHDPSMHWGWAGGYRFIALEGFAGYTPGYVSNNYQIHTIGEENYRKISLPVNEMISGDSLIIPIRADYTKLLSRVDIAGGWESHSTIGKSKQISMNTKYVFTADLISSTAQPSSASRMILSPNPAKDFLTITLPFSPTEPVTMTLTNLNGQQVLSEHMFGSSLTVDLSSVVVPGIYIVTVSDGQQSAITEKLVVK